MDKIAYLKRGQKPPFKKWEDLPSPLPQIKYRWQLPSKINMDLCCIKLLKNHYTYCCIIFVVTLGLLPRLDDDSVSNVRCQSFTYQTQTQAQFLEDQLISFTTGDYRDVIISPTLGRYSVTFIFTNFYKFHPKITTQKPK